MTETIAAIASAPGRGAIGVIRISGAEVPRIAAGLLGTLPAPRVAALRRYRDADGTVLDEGLTLYFPAPESFTGEHVLELQGHGGIVVMDRVLKRVFALGARPARPGEFSERAFLNGKMDLAQAEAVADLIDAATDAAAGAALRSLQGAFSERIADLQRQLTELRVYVEAAIDFPDEEIDFLSSSATQARIAQVLTAFDEITTAARQGAALREGLAVVIAGRPNAGKSSLLNRLVGDDVAIVTDVPGTTRDVLRQQIHLDGLPVNLIDTAGLRESTDVVEVEGIRRARTEIARADRVLYVLDASSSAPTVAPLLLDGMPEGVPVTLVFNKIDLVGGEAKMTERGGLPCLYMSVRTGQGLDLLRHHLQASAGFGGAEASTFSARRRHLDALRRARAEVAEACEALEVDRAVELFAEHLRLAQRTLSEITGEFGSEDLLAEIFGSFCIGK